MKKHRKTRAGAGPLRAQNVPDAPSAPPPDPALLRPAAGGDFTRRLSDLEQDLVKARKDSIDANARASSVDRRLSELGPLAQRLAAAESDVATLRRQIAQSSNRVRDEVRQEFEKEKQGLQAELETVRRSREASGRSNEEVAAKVADLATRLETASTRSAEAHRRVESLERELAAAKKREADREAHYRDALERLEAGSRAQERLIEELKASLADLEGRSRETADAPVPVSVKSAGAGAIDDLFPASAPAAPEPASEPVSVMDPEPGGRGTGDALGSVMDSDPDAVEPVEEDAEEEPEPAEDEGSSEPRAETPSVMDPPPPESEPAEAEGPGELVAEVAKAALDPENLFGPDGADGRPSYVRLDLLTRDALGSVYRAYERTNRGQFAVRFLPAQAGDWHLSKIEQEVQKLIGLPHPNIFQVLGTGRRGNEVYLEMDLIETEPICQREIGEIPRLCMIFRDIAEAVHYAHEEGVFHGDVNPDTLVLGVDREGEGDQAYVKDFGLAYVLEMLATPPGAKQPALALRDPAYIPPEQMKDARGGLTVAADVYGLGASLYSVLTGRPPFEGKDARQVRSRVMMEEPPPIESLRRDVPMALAVVIRRAMAKEPRLRYASAHQLAEGLTGFLEGKGTRLLSRTSAPPSEGS